MRSQAVDPLLARTKSIHLVYSQMGRGSIPSQFRGLLWLGSNAQTLLKAEIGDRAPAGRKKALAQSLSKSLLMFETCQKSQCSLVAPPNSGLALNAATLSADFNTAVVLP